MSGYFVSITDEQSDPFVCIRAVKTGSVWKVGGCMMVNSGRTLQSELLKVFFFFFFFKCTRIVKLFNVIKGVKDSQLHSELLYAFEYSSLWPNLLRVESYLILHPH